MATADNIVITTPPNWEIDDTDAYAPEVRLGIRADTTDATLDSIQGYMHASQPNISFRIIDGELVITALDDGDLNVDTIYQDAILAAEPS